MMMLMLHLVMMAYPRIIINQFQEIFLKILKNWAPKSINQILHFHLHQLLEHCKQPIARKLSSLLELQDKKMSIKPSCQGKSSESKRSQILILIDLFLHKVAQSSILLINLQEIHLYQGVDCSNLSQKNNKKGQMTSKRNIHILSEDSIQEWLVVDHYTQYQHMMKNIFKS